MVNSERWGKSPVRAPGRSRPPQMDGSARCAPRPSSHPSTSRTDRSPRTCSANRKGSSDRMAGGSWKLTAGNHGSTTAIASSWLDLGKPERCQRSLRLQIGERNLERRRAGDQDHVISYSHLAQGRIRAQQLRPRDLTEPAPSAVAVDRALDRPADRHPDPAFRLGAGYGEANQGLAGVKTPAADG